MRRTWDALAAGETAVYVGDPATGASELAGLFGRLGGDPRGGTCVEVGCGPGRMTGALAERFDRVVAVDVSPAMLERARAAVTAPNVELRRASPATGSTASRTGVADALVCYLVLQHLPCARGRRRRTSASSRACSRPAARRSSSCLCSAAGRPRSGGAARGPLVAVARAGPTTGAGLPRLPPDARRARPRRSPTPDCRSSPRTRGRPPYRFSRDRFLRLDARDDRARTRRLRRADRRDRGGRLPPADRRALCLRRSACRCTTSSCRCSTAAASAATRSTRSRRGRRSCSRRRCASVAVAAVRARRLPFRPQLVDWLALAYAAVVLLYAVIPQSALDGHAGARAIAYGLRHDLVLVGGVLPRPLAAARRAARPLAGRGRGGGRRGVGADRGLLGADRVVAPLRRGRLLPPRARLRLPRAGRSAGELRLQHERRALPPPGLDVRLAARDRLPARRRAAPARHASGACAPLRSRSRWSAARAAVDVLALVDRRARDRPARARRRPPPLVAGGRRVSPSSPSASASRPSSTTSRPERTGSRATFRTSRRRRRRKGPCRRAAACPER